MVKSFTQKGKGNESPAFNECGWKIIAVGVGENKEIFFLEESESSKAKESRERGRREIDLKKGSRVVG